MWYNVENLFYPGTDSLTAPDTISASDSLSTPDSLTVSKRINGDVEFTPDGIRRWTWKRYRAKLNALARVIVAAGDWEPPEVVGLCEVEEFRVLEDLVQHPILKPYAYGYVHRDSRDHRGMDVACLYRKERIELVDWSGHSPDRNPESNLPGNSPGIRESNLPGNLLDRSPGTRDMLHLCFRWGKKDSLDVFMVHLVSKYGGAGASAERRKEQVEFLVQLVDSVHVQRPASLKILCGDFNESYEGYAMEPIRRAPVGGDSIRPIPVGGMEGSYKYRGKWSRIDLFLLLGSGKEYLPGGSILHIPPLLTTDETYGGVKPFRTYEGYSYAGGLSDHLPLLLDISRPFFSRPER